MKVIADAFTIVLTDGQDLPIKRVRDTEVYSFHRDPAGVSRMIKGVIGV